MRLIIIKNIYTTDWIAETKMTSGKRHFADFSVLILANKIQSPGKCETFHKSTGNTNEGYRSISLSGGVL